MAINRWDTIEHLTLARTRITEAFKGKVVFDKYLRLLLENHTEIEGALKDLMQMRSLDTAVGVQLDNIGRIVGQERELINTALLDFFGFEGYPTVKGFGDLDDNSQGGLFYNLGNPLAGNTLLSDDQYRLFIKAKILKNITAATPEEFLYFLKFVFGAETSQITGDGGGEFTVLVGKNLSPFERVLLTYFYEQPNGSKYYFVPKPVGVRVNFGQFPQGNFFAFQGVPGAKGFGTAPPSLYSGAYDHDGSIRYRPQEVVNVDGGIFATLF